MMEENKLYTEKVAVGKEEGLEATSYNMYGIHSLEEILNKMNPGEDVMPPYAFAMDKTLFVESQKCKDWKEEEKYSVQKLFNNTNAEYIKLEADKNYSNNIKQGKIYGALIVNGSLFSRDSMRTNKFQEESKKEFDYMQTKEFKKKSYEEQNEIECKRRKKGVPLTSEDKEKLFGKNIIFSNQDGKSDWYKFKPYTLDEYIEAQKDPNHLQKNKSYVVFLTEEEIAENSREHVGTINKLQNAYESKTDIVLAGTEQLLRSMIDISCEERTGMWGFYTSYEYGLNELNIDQGHIIHQQDRDGSFRNHKPSLNIGLIGIKPEILDELVNTYKKHLDKIPPKTLRKEISDIIRYSSGEQYNEKHFAELLNATLNKYKVGDIK